MLAHPFSNPAKGIRGTQKGPACAGPFQQSQYNLANVHNLLLRTDAEQIRTAAGNAHREVRSIDATIVHHATLHIEQAHAGTHFCTCNLEHMAIGNSRELRYASNCRQTIRVKRRPLFILADKDLLEIRNVVSHIFALGSAVRQVFFCFDRFNDNFDGAGGFSLRT